MATSRTPNLLHLMLFFLMMLLAFITSEAVLLALTYGTPVHVTLQNQKLQTMATMLTYALTLVLAYSVMPLLWHRPFLRGLEWNSKRVNGWLPAAGLAMGFAAQGITVFIPHPRDLPIEGFFRDPKSIWTMAVFGVVMGPLFEEVVFRGFLLTGIAIAVDWMRLPRGPDPQTAHAHLVEWQARSDYSRLAWVVASVVTSLLFALMHAPQLAWTAPALTLLTVVSLVLCVVRITFRSVAASTLVHGCYNLSVFLTLFVATGGFRHLDRM